MAVPEERMKLLRELEVIFIASGNGRCDCSYARCEHDLYGWTTAIVLAGLRDEKVARG